MLLELEKIIPPTPRITKGKPIAFGADPKGIFLLYNSGNSVILRNLKDPSKNDMYTQHSTTVHVAKYSPSGFYIASADKSGKVRIWDTVNIEHILKKEYQPFSGPISDLSWSADNSKIIVGGSGQSCYGSVFNVDTGTSVGVIMGMSKNVNSTAFRPTRPFRAITGDDEGLICYFEGPPFNFKHHAKNHATFINVVSYCPTGACFISAGMDGKIFVYDGQTGETLEELGQPAHVGGIYGACFSKDGSRLLSASFDKSLKLWKVDDKTITFLSQYKFDNTEDSMIMGCCWMDDVIVAITFDGVLHIFNAPSSSTDKLSAPIQQIRGHSQPITCARYSHVHKCLITASSNSKVMSFDLDTTLARNFTGEHAHRAHIQGISLSDQYVFTIGYDDRCVLSIIDDHKFVSSIKLPSQPHCLSVHPARMIVVIGCDKHIVLLQASPDGTLVQLDQQPSTLGACSLAMSKKTGTTVVFNTTGQTVVYKTFANRLDKVGMLNGPSSSPVLVGAFSPDNSVIAFASEDRSVTVYSVTSDEPNNEQLSLSSATLGYWQSHSARISSLGWSPSGRRFATGSLDTCIVVYSLDNPKSTIVHRGAHPMSNSSSISWVDEGTLASTALDGSIRVFKPMNDASDGLECFDDDDDTDGTLSHRHTSNFFGCYLLVSLNPTMRGRTYIGFTVNPNRRISQHNAGRLKGGAKSTAGKGPWEMVLIVHGFPNDISALRFEWAWQNPTLSRRLAQSVPTRKVKETAFDYRFRVLCSMLRTGPWNRLGLIIRWINQNYYREFDPNLIPPLHMPIVYGKLQPSSNRNNTQKIRCPSPKSCGICGIDFCTLTSNEIRLSCPAVCQNGQWHLLCIARHMLAESSSDATLLIPLRGSCPNCKFTNLLWSTMIHHWKLDGHQEISVVQKN